MSSEGELSFQIITFPVVKLKVTICCLISIFLLGVISCSKDQEPFVVDYKYDYYPVDSGITVVYQVDSIRYSFLNPGVQIDTLSYFIKETIGDTFLDDLGQINYRVWRYRRDSISQPWQIDRAWSLMHTVTNLQKNEDGLRFIKLVFPPKPDQNWNGNQYIDAQYNDPLNPSGFEYLLDWTYKITALDVTANIGGMAFDSTLSILQQDDENLLEKTYSLEQYAKGVGMIYKELWHLTTQRVDPASQLLPFEEKAENGFILKMTVIDYY